MFLQYNNDDIAKLQAQQNAQRFTPKLPVTSNYWQWVRHVLKYHRLSWYLQITIDGRNSFQIYNCIRKQFSD